MHNIDIKFQHQSSNLWEASGLTKEDSEFVLDLVKNISKKLTFEEGYKNSNSIEEVLFKVKQHFKLQTNSIWRDEVLLACTMFVLGQWVQLSTDYIESKTIPIAATDDAIKGFFEILLKVMKDKNKDKDKNDD